MRLAYGSYYHLYNRGTNRTNLFSAAADYTNFLQRYFYYMEPVADTFAYVLMPNHFHFLLRIKLAEAQWAYREAFPNEKHPPNRLLNASTQFGHCCNGFAKYINAKYHRTGSLFEHAFKTKEVCEERYFGALIRYIHQNPVRHGFVENPQDWYHSSFAAYLTHPEKTRIKIAEGIQVFGSWDGFLAAHQVTVEETFFDD